MWIFALLMVLYGFPALAGEVPKTLEVPSDVLSRAVQVLMMDGGTIATTVARAIVECTNAQISGVQVKMANQPDPCPSVTEAVKNRADAQAELVAKAVKDAESVK